MECRSARIGPTDRSIKAFSAYRVPNTSPRHLVRPPSTPYVYAYVYVYVYMCIYFSNHYHIYTYIYIYIYVYTTPTSFTRCFMFDLDWVESVRLPRGSNVWGLRFWDDQGFLGISCTKHVSLTPGPLAVNSNTSILQEYLAHKKQRPTRTLQ